MENKKHALYFLITNNTSGVIPVSLLNSFLPYNNTFNQTTRYAWNVSSVTYSPLTFSLQARFSSSSSFQTFSGSLAAGNINALVAALNSLNIGTFWSETSGASSFIVTWNDAAIYGNLTVGAASVVQVDLGWQNNTTVAGGNLRIDVNAVTQLNNANPGNGTSGDLLVANGDNIDVFVNASPAEPTYWEVLRILIAAPYTSTTLYSNTVAGSGSDSYSFVISSLYNYQVNWGTPI